MTEMKSYNLLFADFARNNIPPPRDNSSNEDGGRDIFERDKGYREAGLARHYAELPVEIERSERRLREAKETYEKLKTAFVEKYGSEQLANLELTLKTRNEGDSLTVSPEARAFLRDAKDLGRQAKTAQNAEIMATLGPKMIAIKIQFREHMNKVTNALYEMRFNHDPQIRLQAVKILDEATNGPKNFGWIDQAQTTSGTGTATSVAAPTSPSALEIPKERELFKIDPSDNSVKLDIRALANLTPDQMALEQLKKLAQALRKQNGTEDLRDALNRALTDRTAELAAG